MAERKIKTQIGLRRDTEANYNTIAETFKPLKGEICLVDTSEGLKMKVGDGVSTFASLPYCSMGANKVEDECLYLF